MSTCMEHGWQHEQDRCPVCHPEPNYKKMCLQWQSSAMDLAVQLADVEKKMKKMEAVVEAAIYAVNECLWIDGVRSMGVPTMESNARERLSAALSALESDG